MSRVVVFGIIFMAVAITLASSLGYCDVCVTHTMCVYARAGQKCSGYLKGGVSEKAKAAILSSHNQHRQRVANGWVKVGAPGPQPRAANMRVMRWDNELAEVAQRWANQCHFGHDSCRKVSRFEVGQNVFMHSTTRSPGTPDWESAIDSFVDEVRLFNPGWISPFQFSKAIGHYSQVMWADTYLVGCGYSEFQTDSDPRWKHQYYVCNYGPAGNWEQGQMYKRGKPCSGCPGSCSVYKGLCN